jgi:hypothetical protein
MKKSVSIFTAFLVLFLAGCASTNSIPLDEYPQIPNGQGQLVIFSVKQTDPKLSFSGEIECNGVLCARVIGPYRNGFYSIYSVAPKEVVIKAPGEKFVAFVGNVVLTSNALTVKVEPGKRTVVMVTLLQGSEVVRGGQVGNAIQKYRIDLVPESEALPKIKTLIELKLKDVSL